MLVLKRHNRESILIGDNIVITLIDSHDGTARIGIDAPRSTPIHRMELLTAEERRTAIGASLEEGKAVT